MKKLIVILSIAALVISASAAMAAGPNDNWVVQMIASYTNNTLNSTTTAYGTRTVAGVADGTDSQDSSQTKTDTGAMLSCFDLGVGANNVGYKYDYRAPMLTGEKVWNLSLWRGATYSQTSMLLRAWNPSGATDLNGAIKVKLVVVDDPTGTFDENDVIWSWDATKNGGSTTPAYSTTFTNCGVLEQGNATSAIKLKLIASVPEPGSLVAMFSGLIGIVGYGIRRRK